MRNILLKRLFRVWNFINLLGTFLVLVFVPLALLIIGIYRQKDIIQWWPWVFIIGGAIFVLFSRIFYVAFNDPEELEYLQAELKYLGSHALSAWNLGGSIACILLAGYFIFPNKSGSLHDRYATSLSIYLSILAVTLAVHAFYRETAPITKVNDLLERVTYDLRDCKRDEDIWFVYPALNIGYYRNINFEQNEYQIPTDSAYYRFTQALTSAVDRVKHRAKAITYPEDLYHPQYQCYEEMIHGSHCDNARVQSSVREAKDLLARFKGSRDIPRGIHYTINPASFPQHVILIGNIVYLITSYGLPLYDAQQTKFLPIQGEKKVAKLLVYRRIDSALSEIIADHLKNLAEMSIK